MIDITWIVRFAFMLGIVFAYGLYIAVTAETVTRTYLGALASLVALVVVMGFHIRASYDE